MGNLHWMGEGMWLIRRLHSQPGRECSALLSLMPSILHKSKQRSPSQRILVWFPKLKAAPCTWEDKARAEILAHISRSLRIACTLDSQGNRCGTRAGKHSGSLGVAIGCAAMYLGLNWRPRICNYPGACHQHARTGGCAMTLSWELPLLHMKLLSYSIPTPGWANGQDPTIGYGSGSCRCKIYPSMCYSSMFQTEMEES